MTRWWMGAALLAAAAGASAAAVAGQAQRVPTPQPRVPAPVVVGTGRVLPGGLPASALLPNTQALYDGYVRDGKMAGVVGGFGVGDLPTAFVTAGTIRTGAGAPKADPDTLWRVYSMTKPITGMAVMMLVEDGKLRLDQPLSDIYPAYRSMRVLVNPDTSLETRPATRPITIRGLVTHTAGLGYHIIQTGPIRAEYERRGIVPGLLNVETEGPLRTARPMNLQMFAQRVATLPLVYEPGTRWSYSIGLDVAAAVVEKVSGMPFERFVETRLFAPLKMRSSFWQVPRVEARRLADNYAIVGDRLTPLDPGATSVFLQRPSFPYGGAGLVMSARDYDRFLHMLQDEGTLDGVRVMKAETVRLAMSNLLPPGVTFNGIGSGTGGTQGAGMGFGAGGSVLLADTPGGGPGRGTYGWGGAAGTIAWVDPAKRARGVVMVNYMPPEQWPLRAETAAALARDVARYAH
jgi:CubicO group peptidase (beta-lactamase class C family)